MKRIVLAVAAGLLLAGSLPVLLAADDEQGPALFDMDTIRHKADPKDPAATVELVDGKVGKACKFDFKEGKENQVMTGFVGADPKRDEYEGFSFWVKGDGTDAWMSFELIDSANYGLRYAYGFPLKSKEWTKITVPWKDVLPELAGPLMGVKDGFKPSAVDPWWVGRWGPYWQRLRPACSFTLDDVRLEKKVAQDTKDYTPKDPLAKVVAKIKAKKPITFVSMGDSLTDKNHNSNSPATVKTWAEQLAKKIEDTYGCKVTYVNPAIGGTTLTQNLIIMGKWLAENPEPDLVTVFFGGNDYNEMSGQKISEKDMGARYTDYMTYAVDRIRRDTKGSADIILMTTAPGWHQWDTYKPVVEAIKTVAKDKKTALADVDAEFKKAGTADDAMKADPKYWHWDNVHMGPKGHQVIADLMFKTIQDAVGAAATTQPDAK